MQQPSRHQQNIIRNYYKNRETISLQKLQETVTDLYLAEGKKRAQLWTRVAGHLDKLGVTPARVQHLVQKDDPALVAKLVQELMAKK